MGGCSEGKWGGRSPGTQILEGFQVYARVDVTDVGRPAFPQSTCPYPTDGFIDFAKPAAEHGCSLLGHPVTDSWAVKNRLKNGLKRLQ